MIALVKANPVDDLEEFSTTKFLIVMEEFMYQLPSGENQDILDRAIRGRGAFRRFKDKLYDLELEQQWYKYCDEAYERIAREWCARHKIDVVE